MSQSATDTATVTIEGE